MMAHFNTPGHQILDHFVFALAGDGCMMEGVASEACSLAGHLGLGNLIVYYDSNHISIDGPTDITFSEDVGRRFEAYGWQVLRGSMYNFEDIASLTAEAKAEKDRPSLIILDSIIGKGAPTKQGTSSVHGSPLGDEEARKTKEGLGIPLDKPFWVAPEAYSYFKEHQGELEKEYDAWQLRFEAWQKANPSLAQELTIWLSGKEMHKLDMPSFAVGDKVATRNASGKCLAAISTAWPNFIGGSADLTNPNVSQLPQYGWYSPCLFKDQSNGAIYLLWCARACHGSYSQWNCAIWRLAPLCSDIPGFFGLSASGLEALRTNETACNLRAYPRFDICGRRWTNASANRSARGTEGNS